MMEGMIWWQGNVRDNNDPEKSGKVQVEIYGWYELPPAGKIRKENLPWAVPILPTTSATFEGVSDTPQFENGSRVFGFFIDGEHAGLTSKPYIVGTLPIAPGEENKNSIPMLARGKDTIKQKKVSEIEPESSYKAEYPFNRVIQTRNHVIELDDTKGSERIRIHHGSGAEITILPDGTLKIKSVKDRFELVGGNLNIDVRGDTTINSDGNLKIKADKNIDIQSKGDINMSASGKIYTRGYLGINNASGADVIFEAPGGVGVTEGGLFTLGSFVCGNGKGGAIVVGGRTLSFNNGILTYISD